MGSQTLVKKKLSPNLCRGNAEPIHSSNTSSSVISTTDSGEQKGNQPRDFVAVCAAVARNEREPATGPALGTFMDEVATLALTALC